VINQEKLTNKIKNSHGDYILSLKFIVSIVLSEGYVLRVRVGKLADIHTLVSSYIHTYIK
jgi:hypothetical protein